MMRELFDKMQITSDVVMLGDSLTANVDWHELLPDASIANRAIAGDTVRLMLIRLWPIIDAKPKKVFVMAGINDLLGGEGVDQIAKNYQLLISLLSESGISVFVQSTLLTRRSELNRKVVALNNQLNQLCHDPLCHFIDLNSRMAPNGELQDTMDGIHLSLSGYLIWRELISSHVGRRIQ